MDTAAGAKVDPKKKWGKIKAAVKISSGFSTKKKLVIKPTPDVKYLLIYVIPFEIAFKEISYRIKDLVTANQISISPPGYTCTFHKIPKLSSCKILGGKVEIGQYMFCFEPKSGIEDGSEDVEEKSVLISIGFSVDEAFSNLCEKKSVFSEEEISVFAEYHRLLALNPRAVMLMEHCLSPEPVEMRSWTLGLNWAIGNAASDAYGRIYTHEDIQYREILFALTAQCIVDDVSEFIKCRSENKHPKEMQQKKIFLHKRGRWEVKS